MCNIAGYVGSERAAPILLEMIERQEGLAGGFYTGIATVHEGTLRWRKVVGDCARLRRETDAAELPGAMGLAHSRSNSGGDRRWSHPFIGCDDGLAYIANGSMGWYADRTDTEGAARRLLGQGHVFTATAEEPIGSYPALPAGGSVHVSDVMAHAIGQTIADGHERELAIERTFLALPAEVVGLFIAPRYPGQIFGARYNLPLCVAINAGGARAASSPRAFGVDTGWWTWIPPSSVATIDAGGVAARPMGDPDEAITDDIPRAAARALIERRLAEEGDVTFGGLTKDARKLSGRDHLIVVYDPVYETLWEMEREGVIEAHAQEVAGAEEGLTAPRLHFRWADEDRGAKCE